LGIVVFVVTGAVPVGLGGVTVGVGAEVGASGSASCPDKKYSPAPKQSKATKTRPCIILSATMLMSAP
jgi:hypothetical protein